MDEHLDHLLVLGDDPAPADVTAAVAAAGIDLGAAAAESRTVLDTFDGRLHSAGLRLELVQGSVSNLVLRAGPGQPVAAVSVARAPRWPLDVPPGPFAARIAAVTRERALLPVVEIRALRSEGARCDKRGKATVQAALHQDIALASSAERDASLPRWALEITPVAGHSAALQGVLDRLAARGLRADTGDLVSYVAGACGVPLEGRTASPTVPLDPATPAADAFRSVLGNMLHTLEDNVEGTIADIDPEFLHDLRVAVRRSRSVLGEARGVLDEDERQRLRSELAWLGRSTGPARDLAVELLEWDRLVAPISRVDPVGLEALRAEIDQQRLSAHRSLVKDLRSARTRRVVEVWRAVAGGPGRALRDTSGDADGAVPRQTGRQPIGPVVARRIERAQRRLIERGRSIDAESPAETLHDLRKDAKRLRYMLECFGSLLAPRGRKQFVSRLKDLQDNLGAHQDAEIQAAHLRELADELHGHGTVDAAELMAMGQLAEVLEQRRAAEREDFAARFARYDRPRTAKALDDLLAPLRAVR